MNTTNYRFQALFLAIFLLVAAFSLNAQENQMIALKAEDLLNGKAIELNQAAWKYRAGDDLSWADPNLDDTAWETLESPVLTTGGMPKSGWSGIGWFRLRLRVDESLDRERLTLLLYHWGASETYVDGRLISRFGTVGATPDEERGFNPNGTPILFDFENPGEHLIAIRHSATVLSETSSLSGKWLLDQSLPYGAGFLARLNKTDDPILEREAFLRFETGNRLGRSGLMLTIGLLFLLLFYFLPSRRANLYFALFALGIVLQTLGSLIAGTGHSDLIWSILYRNLLISLPSAFSSIALLVFLYTVFATRIPKYLLLYVAAWTVFLLWNFLSNSSTITTRLSSALVLFASFEGLRIITAAVRKKMSGAWIVGIGVLLFTLVISVSAFSNFGMPPPDWLIQATRLVGVVGIALTISIYLTRDFARLPKIEAENERRARELEEARQLQLSMLPKKLPEMPNLEIAAYMRPASEVGGDYYDFHVGADETLTVAVGDATGHGLKAATVVTATKSLFGILAHEPDIVEIFGQSSAALKRMNLRGMFMAMTILKIKGNKLQISSAGMPATLLFKAQTKTVEEVFIKAMPLGSVAKFPYERRDFELSPGDIIIAMSDGFPEMFNPKNELLGFDKAAQVLLNAADKSAQEIINYFVETGDGWARARPADDDVTFVVVKIV